MGDDDAKEWVTVKIPKEDRDKSKEYRPDGATHGDCLVAGAERLNEHLDSDTQRFGETLDIDDVADRIAEKIDSSGGEIPDGLLEVTEASDSELEKIREELEQLPDRTADELEGRMR